jgi:tetratricopeptide (TPR) repeat protein
MEVVAMEITKRIEPYAAGLAMFTDLHRQHELKSDAAPYMMFKTFINNRLNSEVGANDSEADYAAFRNLLGMAASMAGKPEDAEREFLAAMEADPDMGHPQINLALEYVTAKRFDDALKVIERALATPGVRKTPFLRANAETVKGLALWGRGDLQAASNEFDNAARAFPNSFFAYYYWSKLIASVGDQRTAKILTSRANVNITSYDTYPESMLLYYAVRPDKEFSVGHVDLHTARTVNDVDAQASMVMH